MNNNSKIHLKVFNEILNTKNLLLFVFESKFENSKILQLFKPINSYTGLLKTKINNLELYFAEINDNIIVCTFMDTNYKENITDAITILNPDSVLVVGNIIEVNSIHSSNDISISNKIFMDDDMITGSNYILNRLLSVEWHYTVAGNSVNRYSEVLKINKTNIKDDNHKLNTVIQLITELNYEEWVLIKIPLNKLDSQYSILYSLLKEVFDKDIQITKNKRDHDIIRTLENTAPRISIWKQLDSKITKKYKIIGVTVSVLMLVVAIIALVPSFVLMSQNKKLKDKDIVIDLYYDNDEKVKYILEEDDSDLVDLESTNHYAELAKEYYKQINYEKSLEYYMLALKHSEKQYGLSSRNSYLIWRNIYLVYKDQGNFEKAIESINEALVIFNLTIETHEDNSFLYFNLIDLYLLNNNPDKAYAILLSQQFDESEVGFDIYFRLGNIFADKVEYLKSNQQYTIALKYCNDKTDQFTIYSNIYLNYRNLDDDENSKQYLLKVVNIIKENNSGRDYLIAELLYTAGNYDLAQEYADRALLSLDKKTPSNFNKLILLYNVKLKYFRNLEEYDSALKYYKELLRINLSIVNNDIAIGECYSEIAQIYFLLKDYTQGNIYADYSIELLAQYTDNYDLFLMYIYKGINYYLLEKYDDAINFALMAKDVTDNIFSNDSLENQAISFFPKVVIANCYYDQDINLDEVQETYLEWLVIYREYIAEEDSSYAYLCYKISYVYMRREKYINAIPYLVKTHNVLKNFDDSDSQMSDIKILLMLLWVKTSYTPFYNNNMKFVGYEEWCDSVGVIKDTE